MNKRVIPYYTKLVYGTEKIYLADSQDSKYWYRLTDKKTITTDQMISLVDLTGVTFERVFESIKSVKEA